MSNAECHLKQTRLVQKPRWSDEDQSVKPRQNKSLNRKIKRIQNDIELKYKDVYSAATDISTTTALTLLNEYHKGIQR